MSRCLFVGMSLLASLMSSASAQTAHVTAGAYPADEAILDKFQDYPIVLLGEMHGSAELHAFLRSMLANPRFTNHAQNWQTAAVIREEVLRRAGARW